MCRTNIYIFYVVTQFSPDCTRQYPPRSAQYVLQTVLDSTLPSTAQYVLQTVLDSTLPSTAQYVQLSTFSSVCSAQYVQVSKFSSVCSAQYIQLSMFSSVCSPPHHTVLRHIILSLLLKSVINMCYVFTLKNVIFRNMYNLNHVSTR